MKWPGKAILIYLLFLLFSHSTLGQSLPAFNITTDATPEQKKIFGNIPKMVVDDQLLRGEISDVLIDARRMIQDSAMKARLNRAFGEVLGIQEQYIDRFNIDKLLNMVKQGGYFGGFIYGKDTIRTLAFFLHVPLARKDSSIRADVKKVLEKEYNADRLGMTSYATALWHLNQRKGTYKDYFSVEYIGPPKKKNVMRLLRME